MVELSIAVHCPTETVTIGGTVDFLSNDDKSLFMFSFSTTELQAELLLELSLYVVMKSQGMKEAVRGYLVNTLTGSCVCVEVQDAEELLRAVLPPSLFKEVPRVVIDVDEEPVIDIHEEPQACRRCGQQHPTLLGRCPKDVQRRPIKQEELAKRRRPRLDFF